MSKREAMKPFIWGAVLGGIAVTIVGFSADWVVTTGSRDQQVQSAWVDGQAGICTALVQAHRNAAGDVTDLTLYDARATRDEFAKTFAVALPGEAAAAPDVVKACSTMLGKKST